MEAFLGDPASRLAPPVKPLVDGCCSTASTLNGPLSLDLARKDRGGENRWEAVDLTLPRGYCRRFWNVVALAKAGLFQHVLLSLASGTSDRSRVAKAIA